MTSEGPARRRRAGRAFVALGVGCGLAALMASSFETELYRVPMVIGSSTFGWSVSITLVATALSALLVRRRLDHLDLIGVLKTRE